MKVCIIGTGYVGLVTGASLAYLNHQVTCVDIDAAKIEKMRQGLSPIYEPGLDDLLQTGINDERLSFTTKLDEGACDAEVIFIAVGTPPNSDGTPNLSYVKDVARDIGCCITNNYQKNNIFRVIINKSTVPLGSGNWVEMLIRKEIKNQILQLNLPEYHLQNLSETFAVVSNPEFLREGSAIGDTFYADRIVVGSNNPQAVETLEQLYAPLINQEFEPPASIAPRPAAITEVPFVVTDLTSAEMIKYAANSFLAMKISFANEIAGLCELTGADVGSVAKGIGLDSRIGSKFLNAGIGWGGSCFGKDVSALIEIAKEYGYQPELLESARSVNQKQRQMVVKKLQNSLKILKGKTIGLLGLAFKPDTDDVRDAPSFDIASALIKMGAHVKVYDPVATSEFKHCHPEIEVEYSENALSLAEHCDALVVVTEWAEFKELNLQELKSAMSGSLLIDGRNIFEPETAANYGFEYIGIGRQFPKTISRSKTAATQN